MPHKLGNCSFKFTLYGITGKVILMVPAHSGQKYESKPMIDYITEYCFARKIKPREGFEPNVFY